MITEGGYAFVGLVSLGGGVVISQIVDWLFYPIMTPMGLRTRLAWLAGSAMVVAVGTWFFLGLLQAAFDSM